MLPKIVSLYQKRNDCSEALVCLFFYLGYFKDKRLKILDKNNRIEKIKIKKFIIEKNKQF